MGPVRLPEKHQSAESAGAYSYSPVTVSGPAEPNSGPGPRLFPRITESNRRAWRPGLAAARRTGPVSGR